jgi:hypothetical protein
MRALSLTLLLVLGCGTVPALDAEETTEASFKTGELLPEIQVVVERAQVSEDEPIIVERRVWLPKGWTADEDPLTAPDLDIQRLATSDPTDDGGRTLQITRSSLRGPPGNYIVMPGEIRFSSEEGDELSVRPPSIFVDLGVESPVQTVLTEFETPPPNVTDSPEEPQSSWLWPLLAGTLVLLSVVLWVWRRHRRPAPPLSPMDAALRDWREARRAELDDQALAYQLSWIFRGYLEALDEWPARSRTSHEVLSWLQEERESPLDGDTLSASERILHATDRLKFGGEGGGTLFFDRLEQDLHHVIHQTTEDATQDPSESIGGPHV